MKVLVTGSSGYIGSHLCAALMKKRHEVSGLDISMPNVDFDQFLRDNPQYTYRFLKQNINAPFDSSEEYDAVIHLAAKVRVNESKEEPIQYYITNLNGTMNVMSKIKTNNFIFASTGVATHCYDPYGTSKKAAEDCVIEYFTKHRPQDFSIFRFYNVLGTAGFPVTNPDGLMYNLVKAMDTNEFTIFGNDYDTPDGTCVRDYVHVSEIVEALIMALDEPANGIESLGHGVGRSVKDIVDLFKQVNEVDFEVKYAPAREGDLPRTVFEGTSKYMKGLYDLETLLKL